MVHIFKPSNLEAEPGRFLWVWRQSDLAMEFRPADATKNQLTNKGNQSIKENLRARGIQYLFTFQKGFVLSVHKCTFAFMRTTCRCPWRPEGIRSHRTGIAGSLESPDVGFGSQGPLQELWTLSADEHLSSLYIVPFIHFIIFLSFSLLHWGAGICMRGVGRACVCMWRSELMLMSSSSLSVLYIVKGPLP